MDKFYQNQMNEGMEEHQADQKTPEEFLDYENMSEEELLKEYKKQTQSIEDQRKSYEKAEEEARKNGTDEGMSYIGDNEITMERIKKLQEVMDQRGIPYEDFK